MHDRTIGFPIGTLESGNAAKFLTCLKTEIIPFIDTHYHTNADRGISGHSLGGLFTAYCFIHASDLFTRFGINSPSLWWANQQLLNQFESKLSDELNWLKRPTRVFLSVGAEEGSEMVPSMVKLSTLIEEMPCEHLEVTWKVFHETHQSVIPANLCRSLRAPKRC